MEGGGVVTEKQVPFGGAGLDHIVVDNLHEEEIEKENEKSVPIPKNISEVEELILDDSKNAYMFDDEENIEIPNFERDFLRVGHDSECWVLPREPLFLGSVYLFEFLKKENSGVGMQTQAVLVIQVASTRVVKKNLNPVWNQEFIFPVVDDNHLLKLYVWDKDRWGCDDKMGKTEIDVRDLMEKDLNSGKVVSPCKQNFLYKDSHIIQLQGEKKVQEACL
ncbi:hypothetical protein SUGI_0125870 [Cryptomeria japonica]|nr:hypothetical protein SUGI_0125870 [Cryptomeria japonica]